MNAHNGAEVHELVVFFLLNLLGQQYNTKNLGLYRNDGLSTFKNCSGPQMEKIKKRLKKVLKNNQARRNRENGGGCSCSSFANVDFLLIDNDSEKKKVTKK